MPFNERKKGKLPSPGPYLAEVANHLDPEYMGRIEVALSKGIPSRPESKGELFICNYMTPFYGVTSARFQGNNSGNFNDVQKSYGMWMVPPDVGTTVMVIFIDGDPNQGYWIGCIPDRFQNHMVPGIAASRITSLTPEQRKRYGTDYLPVAEFNKKVFKMDVADPYKIPKPVHPFADRLLAQGLLLDTVRGVTSSSARRDLPSGVFGISTPGPLDTNGPKKPMGFAGKVDVPVSRLGGSTFVMDDGDAAGQNELVRIRTRTGHQILLHNSSDLIYIANGQGTAWIELTGNGKIDIYAQDSISIHTEADFNFKADRDVNIEAGRNLNLNSFGSTNINVSQNYNLLAQDGSVLFAGSLNQSTGEDTKLTVGSNFNLVTKGNSQTASGPVNIIGATNNFTSKGNTNMSSGGNHIETASKIHMNGPTADKATEAESASKPTALRTYDLPNRSPSAGWGNGKFYNAGTIGSIMQRVPTHEPWPQHESVNPTKFNSFATDASVGATTSGAKASANTVWPQANKDQPSEWVKDKEFIAKVKDVAAQIRCSYVELLACMAFETGRTFDPAKRNGIGATGLIQFIPSTAIDLGTTTLDLAQLTRTKQMDWVLRYFKKGPLARVPNPNLEDLYMAILWPAAVGQKSDYVLFRAGTKAYQQNPLDIGNKGYITKADAASKVVAQLPYVTQQLVNEGYEKAT